MRRENAFFKFYTFFVFVYHVSCLPWFETKNKKRCIDMPRSMHLHTEIYPNLKSLSELFKMYMKSLDSITRQFNGVSCNQTLGCLRLYGDSRVSRAQPRINAYEILLQHDWLLIFSRQNRFAETHSHLRLSYHITDRLLAAGNNSMECIKKRR